jgi:hypothetical protein
MQRSSGWGLASAILASAIAGVLWAAGALAAAIVADLEGDVRVEVAGAESRALIPGQRLDSGSLVTTARGARVMLRFDDDQWAALHENSSLHIEDYRFEPQAPAADRAVFVLLRGALRIVTGALGRRNPEAFVLRAPKVIVGVRGTDFMVAISNPVYLSVLEGAVVATNAGGSATFKAGEFGVARDDSTPAAAVQATGLPATAASAFGSLGEQRMRPRASSGAAGRATPSRAGQDAAARAREAKENVGRNRAKEAAEAARERARENGSKPRPK